MWALNLVVLNVQIFNKEKKHVRWDTTVNAAVGAAIF
jgi:hypothetical protein